MERGLGFLLGGILTIQCFTIQSMIYLYIKPEVKKSDTTAMTTALNDACIRLLHENCYLVRGIFLVWEMIIFLLLGGIFPPSTGLPPNGRFGERGRAVHTLWGQQAI